MPIEGTSYEYFYLATSRFKDIYYRTSVRWG